MDTRVSGGKFAEAAEQKSRIWRLDSEDIVDWQVFFDSLRKPSTPAMRGLVAKLRKRTPAIEKLEAQVTGGQPDKKAVRVLKSQLVVAINRTLHDMDLPDNLKALMSRLRLTGRAKTILQKDKRNRTEVEIIILNRSLLAALLPEIMTPALVWDENTEDAPINERFDSLLQKGCNAENKRYKEIYWLSLNEETLDAEQSLDQFIATRPDSEMFNIDGVVELVTQWHRLFQKLERKSAGEKFRLFVKAHILYCKCEFAHLTLQYISLPWDVLPVNEIWQKDISQLAREIESDFVGELFEHTGSRYRRFCQSIIYPLKKARDIENNYDQLRSRRKKYLRDVKVSVYVILLLIDKWLADLAANRKKKLGSFLRANSRYFINELTDKTLGQNLAQTTAMQQQQIVKKVKAHLDQFLSADHFEFVWDIYDGIITRYKKFCLEDMFRHQVEMKELRNSCVALKLNSAVATTLAKNAIEKVGPKTEKKIHDAYASIENKSPEVEEAYQTLTRHVEMLNRFNEVVTSYRDQCFGKYHDLLLF
ncbi:MAG: hypothetical protein ACE5IY_12290 [bacterium]